MDKAIKKSSFSAVSSGYNSGSSTTLNNLTMSSSQNESKNLQIGNNCSLNKELSSIVNEFASSINHQHRSSTENNKVFTSYVTGGGGQFERANSHLSDLSDQSDTDEKTKDSAYTTARLENLVNVLY